LTHNRIFFGERERQGLRRVAEGLPCSLIAVASEFSNLIYRCRQDVAIAQLPAHSYVFDLILIVALSKELA
jgi:hypothetical protein